MAKAEVKDFTGGMVSDVLFVTQQIEQIEAQALTVSGSKIYTEAQRQELQRLRKLLNELNQDDIAPLAPSADGIGWAHTSRRFTTFGTGAYANRFKRDGDTLYFVNDYRAISEQANGVLYRHLITGHKFKISRGNLAYVGTVNVKDDDFLDNYTDEFTLADSILLHEMIGKVYSSKMENQVTLESILRKPGTQE